MYNLDLDRLAQYQKTNAFNVRDVESILRYAEYLDDEIDKLQQRLDKAEVTYNQDRTKALKILGG